MDNPSKCMTGTALSLRLSMLTWLTCVQVGGGFAAAVGGHAGIDVDPAVQAVVA